MTDVNVFLLLNVDSGKFKEVANRLIEVEEVRNVHNIFGRYDLIVALSVPNVHDFTPFRQEYIESDPNIQRCETLIISKKVKY